VTDSTIGKIENRFARRNTLMGENKDIDSLVTRTILTDRL